jgi:hypothetical protein
VKTKVLTVLSATVASMKVSQMEDLAEPPSSPPRSSAVLMPDTLTDSLSQKQKPQTSEPLTGYELQKQWLLVKQNYDAWRPRCIPCSALNPQELNSDRQALINQIDVDQPDLEVEPLGCFNGQFPAFEWRLIEAPAGSYSRLSDTDTLTPCLVLDQPGQYRIRFVVDPGANRQPDRQDPATVPAIASELTITAEEPEMASVAIALVDFTVKSAAGEETLEPCLFLVAVYAGLTYL